MKSFLNILKSRLEFFEEDVKNHVNLGFGLVDFCYVYNLSKNIYVSKRGKKELARIVERVVYLQSKLSQIEFDWSKYE